MPAEEWRDVPSEPALEASSWGRIRRKPHRSGTRLYASGPVWGFWQKAARDAKHRRLIVTYRGIGTRRVARLVCEAFHGPAPDGAPYVLHIDEDSANNRPENLKWGTQKENLNAPGFLAYCRSRTGDDSPVKKGARRPRAAAS